MKQELIQKESTNVAPTLPKEFGDEYLQEKYLEVESEVNAEVLEVETVEGRKRIKDLAAKINKSKTVLDDPMRAHLKELKALPKVLEASARDSKKRFESLRESVLEPLTEAQKYQNELLTWLENIPMFCSDPQVTSNQLTGWIEEINKVDQSVIWPELAKKFKVAIENATTTATVTLERVEQQEKQAAELEALRKQQAEAEKKEQDRIVAENAAKDATRLAEQKAQKEREEVDRRAADERRQKENAEHAAKRAIIDKEKAEKKAVDDAKLAEEKAAQALIDAKKREEAAVLLAQENERKRIEEEEAENKRLAEERKANHEHRIKINRAALVALVAGGISEDDAKTVIRMIGREEVPNVHISY